MRIRMVIILLLLVTMRSYAQHFSDTLLPQKATLLERYVPSVKGRLLYTAYQVAPEEILQALARFKQAMNIPAASRLMQQDADFFCRDILYDYIIYYGVDSVKEARFGELLQRRHASPAYAKQLDSAYNARYIKRLSPSQKAWLDSLVFEGWQMDDWELYQYSAAYRKAVENKILRIIYTAHNQDFTAGQTMEQVRMKVIDEKITEPRMKEYFDYVMTSELIKSGTDSVIIKKAYRHFLDAYAGSHYRSALEEIYNNYTALAVNNMAPDFTYRDINHTPVSLHSLRGKYVYIDIWATWCGPCKAEIPALQELEKQYDHKQIRFVSISVDRRADQPVWEKFVKEKSLQGIQLMADNAFESDFIQKCNINAIPRFILIDPQGRIVSGNALRPSDPALRKQLDQLQL